MPQPLRGEPAEKLHEQVYRALREEIVDGAYAPSNTLPPDREIGQRFGVSRITVRKALDDLALAGLIERSQGRRTRVLSDESLMHGDVETEIANTLAIGRGTVPQILSFEWMRPSQAIAARLKLAQRAKALRVTRIRRRDGRPVLHTLAYLPEWLGRGLARADLETTQMLAVLQSQGVSFGAAEQHLSAAPCPAGLARLLDLSPGEPVLRIDRLLHTRDGRPAQVIVATFRWDAFSYRMSLSPRRDRAMGVWT